MTTLVLTITETLRYRGKIGQWSWALHRTAGLGTLLFLFLHVIDTSWASFYPELYTKAIELYQSPLFTVGEFVLVACVVYHALNGFRIVLLDARPQLWHRQSEAARWVFIGTVVLLVPAFALMGRSVVDHWSGKAFTFESLKLADLVFEQGKFMLGAIGIAIGGVLVSVIYSVIPGVNEVKYGKTSVYDRFMWSFMRLSGVLIIPLVFGHLGMMHVIQGVFDITRLGHEPILTNLGPLTNPTLTAAEFVSLRWNTVFAGVFIWRVYDVALLAFTVIHGFHGLRYVTNDYAHNVVVRRGLNLAILATAVGLIVVGGMAIINTIPHTAVQMMK